MFQRPPKLVNLWKFFGLQEFNRRSVLTVSGTAHTE